MFFLPIIQRRDGVWEKAGDPVKVQDIARAVAGQRAMRENALNALVLYAETEAGVREAFDKFLTARMAEARELIEPKDMPGGDRDEPFELRLPFDVATTLAWSSLYERVAAGDLGGEFDGAPDR